MTIWLSHWQVQHMIGKYDLECRVGNATYRFFVKDKAQGYAVTQQMQYEGEWRALSGVSDTGRLQES